MSEEVNQPGPRYEDRALEVLSQKLQHAYEARKQIKDSDLDFKVEAPEELMKKIRECRYVVDVLETVLTEVIYIKMRIDVEKTRRQGEVEDAEVETTQSSGRAGDYVSARDRGIEVNARTLSERRNYRKIEAAAIEAAAVVRMVDVMHRGADAHRKDIETRLRAITLVTSLER